MQSKSYVLGVSGWKLDETTGDFELNSADSDAGYASSVPQKVTVTCGQWSEYDLPANAMERYAFIGAELAKIPAEHRDSAEFSTEDFSFDRDGSDYRTTLTCERLETPEEVAARAEKAKVAGTRITNKGGVFSIHQDGVLRIRIGNLSSVELVTPFVVVDGEAFLSAAFIEDSTVTAAKIASNWSVKMDLRDGKYFAAGIGVGVAQCFCNGGYTGDGPKPADRDLVDLIREAASKGASDGYRAALEDLKKST
jgi:hypothetical protein